MSKNYAKKIKEWPAGKEYSMKHFITLCFLVAGCSAGAETFENTETPCESSAGSAGEAGAPPAEYPLAAGTSGASMSGSAGSSAGNPSEAGSAGVYNGGEPSTAGSAGAPQEQTSAGSAGEPETGFSGTSGTAGTPDEGFPAGAPSNAGAPTEPEAGAAGAPFEEPKPEPPCFKCYVDQDEDGFYGEFFQECSFEGCPEGSTFDDPGTSADNLKPGDCQDENEEMHPGVEEFHALGYRGSFDYNCDGVEEKEPVYLDHGGEGWCDVAPECGEWGQVRNSRGVCVDEQQECR